MSMTTEWWPIDRPIPYARNPRKIGDSAVAKVAGSLKEFGWRQPIVVDAEGVIVVGHTRFLAAQRLGLEEVWVHVASDLSEAKAKAYRLADNRVGEESAWNDSLLSLELADLRDMGADLNVVGFDLAELDRFEAYADHDDTPPDDFEDYDEGIETEHECPQCGYRWSGKGVKKRVIDEEEAA